MAGVLALLALLGAATPVANLVRPDADSLIRAVIASQRRVERSLPPHTYDQHVTETTYARDGKPKNVLRKVFAVTSAGGGGDGSRELLEIDGRPATPAEKRDAAEEDAKNRRRRVDRRAAGEAARGPRVAGDDQDPVVVGPKHLSELLALFDYRLEGEALVEGRRCWILSFRPRPGAAMRTLGDRAIGALSGRVIVDAQDLLVRSATAELVRPVKVMGGLAANVREGTLGFEAQRVPGGFWLPSHIDMRLKGSTALFFRLDKGYDFRIGNFRRFSVSTESATRGVP